MEGLLRAFQSKGISEITHEEASKLFVLALGTFRREDSIKLLVKDLPDPIPIDRLLEWLYSTAPQGNAGQTSHESSMHMISPSGVSHGHEGGSISKSCTSSENLRFDDEAFQEWASQQINGRHAVAWLKAGFLRSRLQQGLLLPHRQELEKLPGAFHLGSPPGNVQLFYVTFAWQDSGEFKPADKCSADPKGYLLRDIVAVLDQEQAENTDLIFMMWSSIFMYADDGRSIHPEHRNQCRECVECVEAKLTDMVKKTFVKILTYWRIRTIVLPRLYDVDSASSNKPYLERLWAMFDIVLSAYCQRIIGLRSDDEAQALLEAGTDPERFQDLEDLFMKQLKTNHEASRQIVFGMLQGALQQIPPIRADSIGFARFCEEAQLAWLSFAYVRELAERGGPFPRRQDLSPGCYHIGAPPKQCRKFVVSHAWETEVHPNPNCSKLCALVAKLAQCRAADNDLVFFDFCSCAQEAKMGRSYKKDEPWFGVPARDASAPAYFEWNNVIDYPPRTAKEQKSFSFAMWEMGRLYSFNECEVIVLPNLEGTNLPIDQRFPGGNVWGLVNTVPYQNRGWCSAEFSISLYCGIIKNLDDLEVRNVLQSRVWPQDNASYARMMRFTTAENPELGVDFTHKGDRAAVKYNFFKMALSLR